MRRQSDVDVLIARRYTYLYVGTVLLLFVWFYLSEYVLRKKAKKGQ